MSLSYEFSIGSVRAKEKSLFTSSDAEQMLALKNENELIRICIGSFILNHIRVLIHDSNAANGKLSTICARWVFQLYPNR